MKNASAGLRASLFVCLFSAAIFYGPAASHAQDAAAPSSAAPAAASDAPAQPSSVSDKIAAKLKAFLSPMRQVPSSQQQRAVELARQGQYDEALEILEKLHARDKGDDEVTRDYATVLAWAGQDQRAVDMYDTLPARQPAYVLAAIGHSYRKLGETDKALEVYRRGVKRAPDNVTFAEGEIRCLIDKGDLESALTRANEDLAKHGTRPEIVALKGEILQTMFRNEEQKAVELARQQAFPEAVSRFKDLYSKHSDDITLTRDYLATLDWQGGNDDQVIALYRTLPEGQQPDYVLVAVGHAYRNLQQFDKAHDIYQQGLKGYPDSVGFMEGAIRTLADQKKYKEALAMADHDLRVHGDRPEIVDIRKNILKQMPRKASRSSAKSHSKRIR